MKYSVIQPVVGQNNDSLFAFTGKIQPISAEQIRRQVALATRDEVERRIRAFDSPYYLGEAERFLLAPFVGTVFSILSSATGSKTSTYVPGAVVENTVQLSGNYAIISEYMSLYQTKELQKDLTVAALSRSRIINAVSGLTPGQRVQSANSGKALEAYISGFNFDVNTEKPSIPITRNGTILDAMYSAASEIVNPAVTSSGSQEYVGVSQAYNEILSSSRQGHGPRLEGDEALQVAFEYDLVLLAIDCLIEQRGSLSSADASTCMTDAILLGMIFLHYVACAENYESAFPATPLQLQTQGWQMTLKSQASRMASHFTYFAAIPQALHLAIGYKFMEAERKFFAHLVDPLSDSAELDRLTDQGYTEFKRLAPSLITELVDEAWSETERYFEATMLVPITYQKDLAAIYAMPQPPATIGGLVFGSSMYVSDQIEYTRHSAPTILATLSAKLQVLLDATTYTTRLLSKLLLSYTEEVHMQPWSQPVPVPTLRLTEQTVSDPHYSTFVAPNPISPVIDKYVVDQTDGTIKWAFESSLFKVIERFNMVSGAVSSTAKMYWEEETPALPADLVSSPLYNSFIPANYTQTRNRRREPLDFARYLHLIEGTYPNVPTKYLMRHVAELLVNQSASFARPLLVALASSMTVVLSGDGAKTTANAIAANVPGTSVIQFTMGGAGTSQFFALVPPMASIYGVPAKHFIQTQVNFWSDAKNVDLPTFGRISKTEAPAKAQVLFVLHQIAFMPGDTVLVPSVLRRGTITQLPYSVNVLLAELKKTGIPKLDLQAGSNVITTGYLMPTANIPSGDSTLTATQLDSLISSERITHIAPFKLIAPHISFRAVTPAPTVQSDVSLARIRIGSYVDEYTHSLVLGAKYAPEYVIMDAQSYISEWEAVDPLPNDPRIKRITPSTVEPIEPERTEGLGEALGVTDAASSESNLAQQAAAVQAEGTEAAVTASASAHREPLSGEPESATESEAAAEQGEKDESRKKKKMKYVNAEGDVLWLMPGEEVPNGYLPASDNE